MCSIVFTRSRPYKIGHHWDRNRVVAIHTHWYQPLYHPLWQILVSKYRDRNQQCSYMFLSFIRNHIICARASLSSLKIIIPNLISHWCSFEMHSSTSWQSLTPLPSYPSGHLQRKLGSVFSHMAYKECWDLWAISRALPRTKTHINTPEPSGKQLLVSSKHSSISKQFKPSPK